MSGFSRIWIYQASRSLSTTETTAVEARVAEFIGQWKAHGHELMAGFTLLKSQFLIIALDESFAQASGCSIDSSVRVLKEMAAEIDVDFLDRSLVAFGDAQEDVFMVPLHEISEKVSDGLITRETMTFNNNLSVLSDLANSWMIPAGESWLKRYFR